MESHLADRDSIGLGLNAKEALIHYLRKIGSAMSKEVRRDKRFRPDGVGGSKFRGVATWEEAHEVVKELEETAAGQRALNNSTCAHGSGGNKSTKTKGADKIHAQDDSSSNRMEQDLKRVCFDMRDRGTCSRGKECKYSHDRAVVDEARRRQSRDKKSGQQDKNRAAKVDDHAKYEDRKKQDKDPKGKGKGGRKGDGKGSSESPKKDKPCRFYNSTGGCRKGSRCQFSHDGPGGAKRGTGPGLQLANAADLTGMKQEGSGMAKDNPFVGCFDTAVLVEGGGSVKTEPVLATRPVERRNQQKEKQKPLYEVERWSDLKSLDQMPKRWWREAENAKGGYQYQTEVKILDRYVGCLLEGCAGCNSITEEVVVGAIREALRSGVSPTSDRFPVAQLERWPKEEVVMGLAMGHLSS